MRVPFFSLLLAVGYVRAAVINLPFWGNEQGAFEVNFTIGTPAQQVTFWLIEDYAEPEADVVVDSETNPGGAFYGNKSSTFQPRNTLYSPQGLPVGVNATDVFTFQQLNQFFRMPKQYIDWFTQAVGIQDSEHVACDLQAEIVFSVGNAEIRFWLPRSVFQRHCVLRDYATFQIGVATRLPPH
ncbi:hypothetical protein M3Y99_00458900 [Aphelenchoides fujianensis]|nr:hypothetical protein M3Y99_00458900 [Aphelenchoides fujianensis]